MRFVIQRVNHANVKIDGEVVGNIGHGLLILFGAGQDDTEEMLPSPNSRYTRTCAKATAQALLMPARLIWLTPSMKNSSQCAVNVFLKLKPADSVLI